jgi:hypothetical protein
MSGFVFAEIHAMFYKTILKPTYKCRLYVCYSLLRQSNGRDPNYESATLWPYHVLVILVQT